MSVSGLGPREKARMKTRDSPVTLFSNPQTSAAAPVKRESLAAPVKREPSAAPVKREVAASVKGEPIADDSPTEAKTEAKTAPMYDTYFPLPLFFIFIFYFYNRKDMQVVLWYFITGFH